MRLAPAEYRFVVRWRFAALVIDIALLQAAMRGVDLLPVSTWELDIANVVRISFGGVYWIATTALLGGSLGKLAVGLRVIRRTTRGGTGWLRSIAMEAPYIGALGFLASLDDPLSPMGYAVMAPLTIVAIADGLCWLYEPFGEGRALHNMWSGTQVVIWASDGRRL